MKLKKTKCPLYNIETPRGIFKLETIPKELKYPRYAINPRTRKKTFQWYYLPWHNYRMALGELHNYIGGRTPEHAYKRMLSKYIDKTINETGKKNRAFYYKRLDSIPENS